MRLLSRLRECLCLNWAVPVTHLPPAPASLRYEVHDHRRGRLRAGVDPPVPPRRGPLRDAAAGQALVPAAQPPPLRPRRRGRSRGPVRRDPGAELDRRRPRSWSAASRRARRASSTRASPDRRPEAGSGRFSPTVGRAAAATPAPAFTASPPWARRRWAPAPRSGAGSRRSTTSACATAGYALSRGALKRIETEQPAVAVSPVTVDLRDAELPRALLGAPDWPELHSAWVCPEMRMRFDLAPERALALPRQAPVPG